MEIKCFKVHFLFFYSLGVFVGFALRLLTFETEAQQAGSEVKNMYIWESSPHSIFVAEIILHFMCQHLAVYHVVHN